MYPGQVSTGAAVIVGDEILSGKVSDTNAPRIVRLFREAGVTLSRMTVIGDEPAMIADEVARCSRAFDYVITSGGIGPTHDDCTIAGVARAFSVGIVRNPELESMIRGFWRDRFNDAALRLAEVPEGARLLYGKDGLLPVVVIQNVYLLPGIPRLFAVKLESLRHELSGRPTVLHSLYLTSDETAIAALLGAVDSEFPSVRVGSYPQTEHLDHSLWVTLEGTDPAEVERATCRLVSLLPPSDLVRVQR